MPFGAVSAGTTTTEIAQSETPQVTIQEIQENETGGTASPYAGETVTTDGTVTAITDNGLFIQDGAGQYQGVFVNVSDASSYAEGDNLNVTAPVEENSGFTRLDASASDATVEKTGTEAVPDAAVIDSSEMSQEAYEGVLVRMEELTVTATPNQFGEWTVDDGSGEAKVDDVTAGDDTTPEESGATIDAIVGPVAYNFDEFKVQPKLVDNLTSPPDDGPEIPENATNLTVLMYNDIQTAMSNADAAGRLVGVVDERRAAHDNPTVTVGGGDQIGPNSLGPFTNWTTPVDVLNELQPDAEVIGNHDLDYGIDSVEEFAPESEFPWLLANLVQEGGENMPGTQNYTIVERGDLKVGVVGLVDDEIFSKTNIDFEGQGYELADYADVGDKIAADLKENQDVDVVIAAAHIGVTESEDLAQRSENIDLIVTGDDEVAYEPQVVDGTAIVEAEGRVEYVGEVNLSVGEDGTVVMKENSRLISVQGADDPSTLPVDETTQQLVQDLREQYLEQVAGKTTVSLDSRFTNYDHETRWGNFITDAFRERTDSQVAITNAGGIRGNFIIEPGNVTYDDIYTSLPFGNYLVEKELTGAQIKTLLTNNVTPLDAQFGSGASLQVSGITYEFIDRPGASTLVRDIYVNGEPLAEDETYTVTVNSFMAGWDEIKDAPTVETDPTQYGTVVAEYLEEQSPITPSDDNRIRRVTRSASTSGLLPPATDGSYELSFETSFVADPIEGTYFVENETHHVVNASSVSLDGDTLTVELDAEKISTMARHSDLLELYGKHNDTEYEHTAGFEFAVVNTNVLVPPQDVDGDGALEDINGDGAVSVNDLKMLLEFRDGPVVQNNVDAFDFNSDGEVDIVDVSALYTEMKAGA